VLELAQSFAARKADLKRSLLFVAFSGEEEGLLGSNHYVKHPPYPIERTVAMINMDMIGRLSSDRLTVQGVGTSPRWPPLLEELNSGGKFDLRATSEGTGPSDHSSFYLRDIPVLFFFTGVHADYHKPSDDADKINAEGQARILGFVAEAVSKIQGWPERPSFTKTQSSPQPSRGFRVSLGTIPEYGVEAEGVPLSGVRQGSPAEKAGLQAGDIIIRVGQIQIKNVYDYTFALGELKPNEEVEVEVSRSGQRLVFKVVPEGRP
jgi:aminopeptidase YwaD